VAAAAIATQRFALRIAGWFAVAGAGAGPDRRLRRDVLRGDRRVTEIAYERSSPAWEHATSRKFACRPDRAYYKPITVLLVACKQEGEGIMGGLSFAETGSQSFLDRSENRRHRELKTPCRDGCRKGFV